MSIPTEAFFFFSFCYLLLCDYFAFSCVCLSVCALIQTMKKTDTQQIFAHSFPFLFVCLVAQSWTNIFAHNCIYTPQNTEQNQFFYFRFFFSFSTENMQNIKKYIKLNIEIVDLLSSNSIFIIYFIVISKNKNKKNKNGQKNFLIFQHENTTQYTLQKKKNIKSIKK